MQKGRRFRRSVIGTLSGTLLLGTVMTANYAEAVSSNGPYYAEPAWDQKLPATTRFVVLTDWNNEAVLDRETGLVWLNLGTAKGSWYFARQKCSSQIAGGRKGWRLPSFHELASLIESRASGVQLPPGHPFGDIERYYWSATTMADNSSAAWIVDFLSGEVGTSNKLSGAANYWCVRGGGPISEY